MANIEHDMVAMLMADIASPEIVARIDEAIEATQQQQQELLELRKMAVRRHGDIKPSNILADKLSRPVAVQVLDLQQDARPVLDLTVAELLRRYQTDERSGFHQLRYKTRENYEGIGRRLRD